MTTPKEARVVCTGGRNFTDSRCVELLLTLHATEAHVFVGDCPTGVDYMVRMWCAARAGPDDPGFTVYRADWNADGRAAGPLRNLVMLVAAGKDALVLSFPGGRGTAHCTRSARSLGMRVTTVARRDP